MHIPNEMLTGAVCPVTAVASAAGVAAAGYFAVKSKTRPTAARFAAVAAFIFAAQMLNFPVQSGTSGHMIGAALAVSLLGLPFGVLAVAAVLVIQTLVFSDGGFMVMGANVLNMAFIGAISGAIVHKFFIANKEERRLKDYLAVGAAAWSSVMLASFACAVQIAISGTSPFGKVVPAMLGVHALIGVGEAVITVVAFALFSASAVEASKKLSAAIPLGAAVICGLLLSPFASGYPDGLEWVAEKFNFLHEAAPTFASPMPDYTVAAVSNEMLSTGLAGIIGVAITFFAVWAIGKGLSLTKAEVTLK